MRSLLLRWSVAIVVGSLWGAVLATAGAKTTQLVSDATRCAPSVRAGHPLAASGDNPMNL